MSVEICGWLAPRITSEIIRPSGKPFDKDIITRTARVHEEGARGAGSSEGKSEPPHGSSLSEPRPTSDQHGEAPGGDRRRLATVTKW